MDTSKMLTAYNVRTKAKGRPIFNAVISKTNRGAYMVQGNDEDGSKLTTLVGEAKALQAIKDGTAKWATGFKDNALS